MPHFNLRYFLETLGRQRGGDCFVLQIGAMDGRTFDPVYEFIMRFRWQGLLVEPVAQHCTALEEAYRDCEGITIANVAVHEHDGTAALYRVRNEDVDNGNVPRWGLGLASIYRDRNALAFDVVQPHVIEETVRCLRLDTLIRDHDVSRIDVLQIDTEGHDYRILKQLDFERFRPLVVHLEIVNLPKAEQTACKALLDRFDYIHTKAGYDLLAVSPAFFQAGGLDAPA